MSSYYEYGPYMPHKGTEAGGGGAFPGGSMRICPSGQTQPQQDPKQQPQAQSMPGGMPGGINYSQPSRAPSQYYQRPSQQRVATARPMMAQTIQSSNMAYQQPQTPMLPPTYITSPMATAAGVILPYTAAMAQSGRHQSHGGGQAGGTGTAPQANAYYPSGQQIYIPAPPHPTLTPSPYSHTQYPHTTQYVYQHLRNSAFPTPNSGPHQGVPQQPPPQQPPQQFMVDTVASSGGGGPVAATGTGVMITHGPPPGPPQNSQQHKRRRYPIPIIDPNSGKNVMDELNNEAEKTQTQSGESSNSATPHPIQNNEYHVAADFAARVAAVATENSSADEELPPVIIAGAQIVNGPVPSPPLQQQSFPAPSTTEINEQSSVGPSIPPPAQSQPQSQPQPPSVQHQPQPLSSQIPIVSAMSDSPPVELLKPKVAANSVTPGRKPTPIPQNVQPILEGSKKKDKKIVGVTAGLPPHKEEPEEVKKSSFAEAFNPKNISQSNIQSSSQLHQTSLASVLNKDPETNGEPEVTPNLVEKVHLTSSLPPQSTKHHEKQKHEEQSASHLHERGGKALPKQKQKKKANLKELNRRGQEKEGGSDMDAFTSLPPTTEVKAVKPPSPPPSVAAPLAPRQQQQQQQQVPPLPASEVPLTSLSPQPVQPVTEPHIQPSITKLIVPSSPPPLVTSNKNVDSEQDEGMEDMGEEDPDSEELLVATKNEENVKVSAAIKDQAISDSDERIVIPTTVIERSKPPVLKYSYKEDQWSPLNPEGKKVYDREFLLGLRTEALSVKRPDIEDCDIIKSDTSNNNNSVSANNNNRRLHGSNSMGMNREGFSPSFLRPSLSQRGGMMGKRGSQQGRPGVGGGGGRTGKTMYSSSQYKSDIEEDLHWVKQGWKPERCKSPPKLTEEEIKTENLYKKVRGILNKLTPQKFDTLLEQITRLPIDTTDRLKGVVELVFDKAVDEPSFSIAYAKLCQNLGKMSVKIESEGQDQHKDAFSFRKVLLNRCQQMFEKKRKEETGEDGKKSDDERIAELQQAIAAEDNKDKKKELQLVLEEEERKIRVKYVGLARFIGELFKLQMLTASIMHGCIKTLLEKIEEESLECLCKLLTTVGKELENQCNPKDIDEYFVKMKKLSQKSSNSKVSSRVRFMLQDVIELRSNRWVPRRDENNPKTMEQIQREAERETFMESAALSSSMSSRSKHSDRDDRRRGPRSGGGGGGGGNNQDPEGWSMTTSKNSFRNYPFDQSKLQHLKGMDTESSGVLGSHTQFSQWNSGSNAKRVGEVPKQFAATTNKFALLSQEDKKMSTMITRKVTPSSSQEKERAVQGVRDAFRDERGNRGQSSNPPSRENSRVRGKTPLTTHVPSVEQEAPPPPVKVTLDPEACKKKSRVIFEEWLANHNVQESVDCIQESFSDAMQFVQPVLESVLEGKALARTSFGELLAALLSRGIVTSSEVTKELALIIESGEDLMIDVPLVWTCLAELLVPLMLKGVYSFTDLKDACEPCRTTYFTRTLAEIFKQLTKEKGPAFIKQQWESSKVHFTDFFPESDVDNFIKTNKCGFLIGEGEVAEAGESLPMDQVEDKLYNLLKSEQNDKIFDHVCEWIKANVGNRTQDADFIKALTRAVIKASIKSDQQHLNSAVLIKHEKLIKRFVDANETRELACLHGIQNLVVVQMLSPQGLLVDIFQSLWENGIISHEAFIKWQTCETSQYEAEGKGVAVRSLTQFFISLSEQDVSDDDSS